MNKSESIAKLALALSKLQGDVQDVHKGSKGYGYTYADLSSVLEVIRPLCAKYELAVTQLCSETDGKVGVETVLMHASGEWISSTLFMPLSGVKHTNQAQAAGMVITYARRYALAAILGVTQTDNDAAQIHDDAPAQVEMTPATGKRLLELLKQKNMNNKEAMQPWYNKFKITQYSELNEAMAQEILDEISR